MTETQTKPQDRLFVPLDAEFHEAFAAGEKDVELRGVNANFNERTVVEGRPAELRRGYEHDPIWGTVGSVWFFDHLANIPLTVDHERILPGEAETRFIIEVSKRLGQYDRFVAFEVTGCHCGRLFYRGHDGFMCRQCGCSEVSL